MVLQALQRQRNYVVWACFAGKKKSELVVLEGKQDEQKYVSTLEQYLLPFGEGFPVTCTFAQDGAPCHRLFLGKGWLEEEFIPTFEWPTYSPEMNLIENLCEILARSVYASHRQFQSLKSLKDCVFEACDALSPYILDKLVKSMRKKCIEVVLAKRRKIDTSNCMSFPR